MTKCLGWLRGLISTNPEKQPLFKQRLQDSIPTGCTCTYEGPSSIFNFTKFQHPDGDHDPLFLPPCWTLILVAESTPKFVELLDIFIQVAVLSPETGWTPQGDSSKVLQRTAAPPGRDPWTEGMGFTFAPRGQYDADEAVLLARIRDKYAPWLQLDGSMAYIQPVAGTFFE